MQIKDLMSKNIKMIDTNASLVEAAKQMKDNDIGFLPVVEINKLVGLLTDRDIAIRAVAEGRDPNQTRVHEASTHDVVFCFEDQDVKEAAKIMGEKQIRRLLIVDRENHPVGVVSLGDLANEPKETRSAEKVLEKVSKPTPVGTN